MTNDIDAIRQRVERYGQTGIGSGKTIQAIDLANKDVPALLAKVDELTAERDEYAADNTRVVAQLVAANLHADGLANENARLREVAQTYRDAMFGQHQWGGHLIEGDCPDCTKAAEEMDGDLACHRYRYWQDEYEAALGTHVPAEATR